MKIKTRRKNMEKQTTYVMVKPEFAQACDYKAIRIIRSRILEKGLNIVEECFIRYDKDHAKQHYHEHVGKPFYRELEEYITSDRAYGMVVTGENAIQIVRDLCGATKNPEEGTIRYDIPNMLGRDLDVTKNVVHSSDSPEAAEREIKIFKKLKIRNMDVCQ